MKKPALIAYECVTWLLLALCAMLIFAFSAQDDSESSLLSMEVTDVVLVVTAPNAPIDRAADSYAQMHHVVRKLGHALEYALLAALLLMALAPIRMRLMYKLLLAVLLCAAYAVFDEFHQGFIDGRTPQALDVLIDTAGAALGSLVAMLIRQLILLISRHDILMNAKKPSK